MTVSERRVRQCNDVPQLDGKVPIPRHTSGPRPRLSFTVTLRKSPRLYSTVTSYGNSCWEPHTTTQILRPESARRIIVNESDRGLEEDTYG